MKWIFIAVVLLATGGLRAQEAVAQPENRMELLSFGLEYFQLQAARNDTSVNTAMLSFRPAYRLSDRVVLTALLSSFPLNNEGTTVFAYSTALTAGWIFENGLRAAMGGGLQDWGRDDNPNVQAVADFAYPLKGGTSATVIGGVHRYERTKLDPTIYTEFRVGLAMNLDDVLKERKSE